MKLETPDTLISETDNTLTVLTDMTKYIKYRELRFTRFQYFFKSDLCLCMLGTEQEKLDYFLAGIKTYIGEHRKGMAKKLLAEIEKLQEVEKSIFFALEHKYRKMIIEEEKEMSVLHNVEKKEKISPKMDFLFSVKDDIYAWVTEGLSFRKIIERITEKHNTTISFGTIRMFVQKYIELSENVSEGVELLVPDNNSELTTEDKPQKNFKSKSAFMISVKEEIESSLGEGMGVKKLRSLLNSKYNQKISVGALTNFAKENKILIKKTPIIKKRNDFDITITPVTPVAPVVAKPETRISTIEHIQEQVEAEVPKEAIILSTEEISMSDNTPKPATKTYEEFLFLLRKSVPEGIPYTVNSLRAEILKHDTFFNSFKYGEKTLIGLLKKFPDDVLIVEYNGYTPPTSVITLLDAKPQVEEKKEEISDSKDCPAQSEQEDMIPEPRATKEPIMTADTYELYEENTFYLKKTTTCLFQTRPNQPKHEFFATFRNGAFQEIRTLAEEENWDGVMKKTSRHSLLRHYLSRTFARLKEEDKIVYSNCGKMACFNTGLLSKEKKEVFLLFKRDHEGETWTFDIPIDSYAMKLHHFSKVPDMANYMFSPENMIFDNSYGIEINVNHIVEDNIDRLPSIFAGRPKLASHAIVGAVEELKARLKRDYSLAVPFYYFGSIQLFLPVDLIGDGKGLVALIADKDPNRKIYRIRTVLQPHVAYGNARVVRRLENTWLS